MYHNRRFHAKCYHCHGCKKQFDIPTEDTKNSMNQPAEVRDLPYCPGDCYREASKEKEEVQTTLPLAQNKAKEDKRRVCFFNKNPMAADYLNNRSHII